MLIYNEYYIKIYSFENIYILKNGNQIYKN